MGGIGSEGCQYAKCNDDELICHLPHSMRHCVQTANLVRRIMPFCSSHLRFPKIPFLKCFEAA